VTHLVLLQLVLERR